MSAQPRKQRTRKTPDPGRFPPCFRCGECYQPQAHWSAGPVCAYCYDRAQRTNGSCAACAHEGVLPGTDAEGRPTCRTCSGIRLSVDCARCGIEDILYRAATCWRCALDDEITGVLTGLDGYIPAALVPLAVAVRTMPRPNSGITWLTNPRVGTVLSDLATGKTELTHEGLDALPASRTVEYIRGLLVEQKTLPARNEQVTAYSRWLPAKLAAIDDPERRRLIETFAQWHQLRLLRSVAPAGPRTGASFLRAKQTTTLAIELLEWLARRGRTLGECSQEDVDAWFATGPSTRCHSVRFLGWAIKSRRVTGSRCRRHRRRFDRHWADKSGSRPSGGCFSTALCSCRGGSLAVLYCSLVRLPNTSSNFAPTKSMSAMVRSAFAWPTTGSWSPNRLRRSCVITWNDDRTWLPQPTRRRPGSSRERCPAGRSQRSYL